MNLVASESTYTSCRYNKLCCHCVLKGRGKASFDEIFCSFRYFEIKTVIYFSEKKSVIYACSTFVVKVFSRSYNHNYYWIRLNVFITIINLNEIYQRIDWSGPRSFCKVESHCYKHCSKNPCLAPLRPRLGVRRLATAQINA